MGGCAVIPVDVNTPYPVPLPHLPVGDVAPAEVDFGNWFDCADVGLTLTQVTWAINADDDDGGISIAPLPEVGLVASCQVTGLASGAGKSYRVSAFGVASDGQKHTRWLEIPVVDTSVLKYASA